MLADVASRNLAVGLRLDDRDPEPEAGLEALGIEQRARVREGEAAPLEQRLRPVRHVERLIAEVDLLRQHSVAVATELHVIHPQAIALTQTERQLRASFGLAVLHAEIVL